MKPLFVLIITFIVSLLVLKFINHVYDWKLAGRIAMCVMLLFTAIGHFAFVKGMSMMIPDAVPSKQAIVYLTGILEIFLGIGLLVPNVKVFSAQVLVIFFVLMLPGNIKAAVDNINYQKGTYDGPGLSYLWIRIPMQFLFIAWVAFAALDIEKFF